MLYSSSVPYDHDNSHKSSIFSGFVASPTPVRNTNLSFLLLSFSYLFVSTVLPPSTIFYSKLHAPQCWPGIWRLWITLLFSSTVLSLLTLSFMLSSISCIVTGNETGSPYDTLGDSLDFCGTVIYSLNCSPRIPLIMELLSVIIESLIVCRNSNEKLVLNSTPYPRARETVTGWREFCR